MVSPWKKEIRVYSLKNGNGQDFFVLPNVLLLRENEVKDWNTATSKAPLHQKLTSWSKVENTCCQTFTRKMRVSNNTTSNQKKYVNGEKKD